MEKGRNCEIFCPNFIRLTSNKEMDAIFFLQHSHCTVIVHDLEPKKNGHLAPTGEPKII